MTKVVKIDEKFRICEQKRQTADYQTLAKMLNTTVDAFRVRYKRKDEKYISAFYDFVMNRENLIKKYQNQ